MCLLRVSCWSLVFAYVRVAQLLEVALCWVAPNPELLIWVLGVAGLILPSPGSTCTAESPNLFTHSRIAAVSLAGQTWAGRSSNISPPLFPIACM